MRMIFPPPPLFSLIFLFNPSGDMETQLEEMLYFIGKAVAWSYVFKKARVNVKKGG